MAILGDLVFDAFTSYGMDPYAAEDFSVMMDMNTQQPWYSSLLNPQSIENAAKILGSFGNTGGGSSMSVPRSSMVGVPGVIPLFENYLPRGRYEYV